MEQCARWFDEYADGHEAKGSTEKAERNRERARYARAANATGAPGTEAPVYVYMPSHWRETISEHPNALIGFYAKLNAHDAAVEEWERVEVRAASPTEAPQHDNGDDGYRCIYCGTNRNDWADQPCRRPKSEATP